MRQRSRWARGMFEGSATNPPHRQPRVLAKFVAGIDYLVPFLDIGYVFFWIPGVILFIFGYPLLFSWWSMLVSRSPCSSTACCVAGRSATSSAPRRPPRARRRGFFGYLFVYRH